MRLKKIIATAVITAMTATMIGCGSQAADTGAAPAAADDGGTVAESAGDTSDADASSAGGGEAITLKVFSNLPDRKNGQGLVEQTVIDNYMAENPNVNIEVEALDEEAYKTKFKAYSMDGMPDVVSIWGQPSFLDEVLDAGVLAELNESDYADYGFLAGSLEGFKKDGKLYGLPRNTDVAVFYYNAKMFEENGWKVPETYDDLLTLAGDIKSAGIIPCAMDGGDGWPLAVYLTDILFKLTNEKYADTATLAIESADFKDANIVKAVDLLRQSVDAGLFQNGYDSQDYGTAQNLFTNGQSAMYYMGSWDSSMALNEDIAEDIRTNIRVFTMPVIDGGAAKATDITAWNGGGYAVSASSEHLDEARKFLNYLYLPENLSKIGWENGVGMSAQDENDFMTGNETEVQKQLIEIIGNATNVSGTTINDRGNAAFKTSIESQIQSVSNGSTTVDEFLSTIAEACE